MPFVKFLKSNPDRLGGKSSLFFYWLFFPHSFFSNHTKLFKRKGGCLIQLFFTVLQLVLFFCYASFAYSLFTTSRSDVQKNIPKIVQGINDPKQGNAYHYGKQFVYKREKYLKKKYDRAYNQLNKNKLNDDGLVYELIHAIYDGVEDTNVRDSFLADIIRHLKSWHASNNRYKRSVLIINEKEIIQDLDRLYSNDTKYLSMLSNLFLSLAYPREKRIDAQKQCG